MPPAPMPAPTLADFDLSPDDLAWEAQTKARQRNAIVGAAVAGFVLLALWFTLGRGESAEEGLGAAFAFWFPLGIAAGFAVAVFTAFLSPNARRLRDVARRRHAYEQARDEHARRSARRAPTAWGDLAPTAFADAVLQLYRRQGFEAQRASPRETPGGPDLVVNTPEGPVLVACQGDAAAVAEVVAARAEAGAAGAVLASPVPVGGDVRAAAEAAGVTVLGPDDLAAMEAQVTDAG